MYFNENTLLTILINNQRNWEKTGRLETLEAHLFLFLWYTLSNTMSFYNHTMVSSLKLRGMLHITKYLRYYYLRVNMTHQSEEDYKS